MDELGLAALWDRPAADFEVSGGMGRYSDGSLSDPFKDSLKKS
jgi:hypothetical protein